MFVCTMKFGRPNVAEQHQLRYSRISVQSWSLNGAGQFPFVRGKGLITHMFNQFQEEAWPAVSITDVIEMLQAEFSSERAASHRRRRILSPLLQSTLPNMKQSPSYSSYWTARFRRLMFGLPHGPGAWTMSLATKERVSYLATAKALVEAARREMGPRSSKGGLRSALATPSSG